MKTVMKKMFCLMLVAVLMVSAVPFGASAAEAYTLTIDVNGSQVLLVSGTSTSYDECLAASGIDTGAYTITNAVCEYTDENGHVQSVEGFAPGSAAFELQGPTRVFFFAEAKAVEPAPEPKPEPKPEPTPDPEPQTANLHVLENGSRKYTTVGTPNGTVSVADCLSCAGINSANVTKIEVTYPDNSKQTVAVNDTFALGAANTTTKINFTTAVPQNKYRITFDPNYNEMPATTYDNIAEGTKIYSIHTPSRKNYTFAGWYKDADLTIRVDSNATVSGNAVYFAKWHQNVDHEVYVKFYTNGKTSTVAKYVDLYEYAQDGVITLDELRVVAKKHIKANTDDGLKVYGPFNATQWESYCLDDYYRNSTEKIYVNANEKTVIYAMVHNAKISGGSSTTSTSGTTADSTNPKTGDMIFMPAVVLGLSASALAVMFYLNKKRAV